jgi:hypothetical protein
MENAENTTKPGTIFHDLTGLEPGLRSGNQQAHEKRTIYLLHAR